MADIKNNNEVIEEKNSSLSYIILFVIFFAIGTALGVLGTYKFLNISKDDSSDVVNNGDGSYDITESKDYQTIITNLHSMVNTNPMFYSTYGVSIETMEASNKLSYMYDVMINTSAFTSEDWNVTYWGSNVCAYDFLSEYGVNNDGTTYPLGTCKITRINKTDILNKYKELFNNDTLDTSIEFYPNVNTKCVADETTYMCGKIGSSNGSLTPKFSIEKVVLNKDNSITIYDRGYLVDTRDGAFDVNDGYENHYLHSSDSTSYYYELKSAENLTFIHTFKQDSNKNYYYYSTVLDVKG